MPMLQRIADGVFSMTTPLRFWGVETGGRMTVVELPEDRLFVHSPLPLTPELEAEVDAMGEVAAIVAPSLFHHMSAAAWKEAYPGAMLSCCPGLDDKRSDVPWDRVLADEVQPEWDGTLQQVHFAARTMEREVVFFHAASKTMICADAIFNLAQHDSWFTRLVALALWNRKPGATWLEHVMIRDRAGARDQIDRMLAWKPERILIAHGPPIDDHGTDVLREAYAWV